ncbi:hypothetical protein PFISCL1PPCAC_28454, partial [Pristionchus fissidentatus]
MRAVSTSPMNMTILSDGNRRFDCETKGYSNKEDNSIRVNSIMVYSVLTCNAAEGYTDIEGKKWANAEDEVELDCKPSACDSRNTPPCNKWTKLPKGYKCAPESNPFKSNPIDTNVLSCGQNEVFWLRNSIFNGKLRCHSDGGWYKIGDSSNIEEQRGVADIMCITNICSLCEDLAVSGSSYDSKPTFTSGTPGTCATIECTNNLWKYTKGGHSKFYSGKILCSSVKEKIWTTEQKYELENNTKVECLRNVKCTDMTRLITACETKLNNFGCQEINLNDESLSCAGLEKDM